MVRSSLKASCPHAEHNCESDSSMDIEYVTFIHYIQDMLTAFVNIKNYTFVMK